MPRSGRGFRTTSTPSQTTVPALGRATVARIRISDDFPAPFGPTRPTTPFFMLNEMSWSAVAPPRYVLLTERTSSECIAAYTALGSLGFALGTFQERRIPV
jgi:hypothetical protein